MGMTLSFSSSEDFVSPKRWFTSALLISSTRLRKEAPPDGKRCKWRMDDGENESADEWVHIEGEMCALRFLILLKHTMLKRTRNVLYVKKAGIYILPIV